MPIKTHQRHSDLIELVERDAAQLQESIYQLARAAMQEDNPHTVAWIVAEHDRVNNIIRKLHRITARYEIHD